MVAVVTACCERFQKSGLGLRRVNATAVMNGAEAPATWNSNCMRRLSRCAWGD
eukprot:CAMPEP_0173272576 /NCGR_PEP_ID=MMETSP1143-20121109/1436_1 /TAXON_ID=483371 /ORGANISM="non described non described, Strain CCMP2298" /LENGTH=52 /DNA_ID=CAMNT_0014209241 /DNA_START=307 /DNA_END=462 /DNA_ORIENTATION=+